MELYLIDKCQYAAIDFRSFAKMSVTYGVLHRSILGPLLFVIYINVSVENVTTGTVYFYVNDTTIIVNDQSQLI